MARLYNEGSLAQQESLPCCIEVHAQVFSLSELLFVELSGRRLTIIPAVKAVINAEIGHMTVMTGSSSA